MVKANPIKIALALAALALALALAAGLLYRAPALDGDKGVNGLAVVSGFLLVAFYAWWASRNFRREQRRRWSLWQIALLTALTGLAVQLSGGLSSFLLGFYLLPVWLAVFHAEPRWQPAPPLAAAVIELGSCYWGDRLFAEAVPAVFFAAMLALSFAAAKLFSRRALTSAAAPAAFSDDVPDEPSAAGISLQQDLAALCALVQAAAGSRTCAVFRLEAMGSQLRLLAFKSYSPNVAPDAAIDVQRGILGWVVRERQGLLYPSYDKDFRALGYYARDEAIGSVLAVPVRDGDAVRGMVVVDSERDKAFDESGKLLLAGFAEMAGRMMALHQSHSALGLEKERLEEWNKRLELMASRLTTAEVIKAMKELVPVLVDCDHLCLLEMRPGSDKATVLLSDPPAVGYPIPGSTVDISGSLAEQAVRTREWRLIDDFYRRAVAVPRFSRGERQDHGFRSVLAGPLLYEDQCHYVLVLESRRPRAFDLGQSAVHLLAGQFALALRSAAQYEEKEQMAVRDGLTGLANHRRFQEYLSEAMAKAEGKPLAVALFDIDHFKKLNDTYGHPVGDAVLKEVAVRLRETISQYDFVARYGGEEFIAVWPGRNDIEAAKLAEEVRQAIANKKFATAAGELTVTISLGVAASPQDAAKKPELIKAADEALYAAKHGGRNKVCRYAATKNSPAA